MPQLRGLARSIAALMAVASALLAADRATATQPTGLEAAGAFFEARDASGCVLTRVDISASRADGSATSAAETFITSRNTCTATNLLVASESGPQAVVFSASGLGDARLAGWLTVHDVVSGADLEVSVQVDWTGLGTPTVNSGPIQTHRYRQALASGSLTIGGAPLVSGAAASGAIERVSTRQ